MPLLARAILPRWWMVVGGSHGRAEQARKALAGRMNNFLHWICNEYTRSESQLRDHILASAQASICQI